MSNTLEIQPGEYTQAAPSARQELHPLASVPWVAVALAVHVLLLVIAWFIIPYVPMNKAVEVITASTQTDPLPPPPEMRAPENSDWPDPDKVVEQPSPVAKLSENAEDERAEDPSEIPNQSLAPSDSDSDQESTHPNKKGNTGAVGLGGGIAGGGGRRGDGGLEHRRPRGDGPGGHTRPQVESALRWLADHQSIEGNWSATRFSEDSRRKNARKTYNLELVAPGDPKGDRGWDVSVDVGLTGLSLLAFTGAGYDHKTGPYTETCRRGVMYLRKVQYEDGCFGPKDDDHFVYNHAICTMAVVELYDLSGDSLLKNMSQRAVDFILKAQNPGSGWRYGVKPGENDTSVTGWMVLALKSAKMAGLEFEARRVYREAAQWLDVATVEVNGYPKTGYNLPGSDNARLRSAQHYQQNPSMDSINIMTRLFMEDSKWDVNHPILRKQAAECARNVPAWEHTKLDFYYWYYASLALYQMGGSSWNAWEGPMSKTLLNSQRGFRPEDRGSTHETLDEHGSWDPVDAWGSAGGRVYATAINCLTLEVWNRFKRVQESKK